MAIRYPDEAPDPRSRRRLLLLIVGAAAVAAVLIGILLTRDEPAPTLPAVETLYEWTTDLPAFTDVTTAWGFDDWGNTAAADESGGVAIADLDGDGWPDLVTAGGAALLYRGSPDGFVLDQNLADDAVAVDLADIDGDTHVDILLGRERGPDLVLWGDRHSERTEFVSDGVTTGLVAADYDEDGRVDLLQLSAAGSPDTIWRQTSPRSFEPIELPGSNRASMAVGVADLDGLGGLDLWITRADEDGDSLYVRTGPTVWEDAAADYGFEVRINGSSVVLSDLSGDGLTDVYLSDLGRNDLLRRSDIFFTPGRQNLFADTERGIGRIRPPGAPSTTLSYSRATGLADLNLDGYLDLVVVNGGGTDEATDTPSIFLGLPGGFRRWADVFPDLGLEWSGSGRGLALGDLDNDLDTDIVITTRDAGLRVFRNDATAAAVLIEVEGSCDTTGLFVNAFTDALPYRLPIGPPTFLGRHAREFILGTRDSTISFPSGDLSRGPPRHILDGIGRQSIELACDEVGLGPAG